MPMTRSGRFRLMKTSTRLVVASLITLISLTCVASAANAQRYERVAIFNLTDQPKVEPTRFYLSASSGPYLKKLDWSNWGSGKTVGRGRFIADCASCGPKENMPVRFTLRKLIPCPKYKVMTYKSAVIKVIDPERPNRYEKFPLGCI